MEDERSSSVVIDVDKLYLSLTNNNSLIDDTGKLAQEHICKIRGITFDPLIVSIGPNHHGKQTLQVVEKQKWTFLEHILKLNPKRTLNDYIKTLGELYPSIRTYYANEIEIKRDKFIRMLLLDGCFILLSLRGIDEEEEEKEDCSDIQITNQWNYDWIQNDIFLVDNQIPFCVVNKIYEIFTGENNTLAPKIANAIEQILWNYPKSINESNRPSNFHHLLHLCHMYFRPSENYNYSHSPHLNYSRLSILRWRRALEYHIAGVEIQKRDFDQTYPHSLLDLEFDDNVIKIPSLDIDENTTGIFRSLVALEQTSSQYGNDITAYIIFMSHFVSSAEDAAFLVSKGIIQHQLQSNEQVSKIFVQLSDGVDFDLSRSYYLKSICHSMESYYQSRIKSWKGWLKHKRFRILGHRIHYN